MSERGFCLTYIFPYKGTIVDCVFILENTNQRKPIFWHIFRSAAGETTNLLTQLPTLLTEPSSY